MTTFKEFAPSDVKTTVSVMEQVWDVIQNDISSSVTRKQYPIWMSGSSVGSGVTSSFFQTVFDQDFSLQTANSIMNVTFGLSKNSDLVSGSVVYTNSTTGLQLFPSQSVQMREKIQIYETMASSLLGDADTEFQLISGPSTFTIREALFLNFSRLFVRDRIKRESFGIRLMKSASSDPSGLQSDGAHPIIYTDVGSTTNREMSYGGQVSTLVNSADTGYPVGLLYLDKGIVVLDTQRVFDTAKHITGSIDAVSAGGTTPFSGSINKLFVSASIDDICDHLCSTRFSNSNETAIAFKSETVINTTTFYCRFGADEFNYSSNPTYVDEDGRIVVIETGQEDVQKSFTFITSIAGYDANDTPMWVGKLSRPIYKDYEREIMVQAQVPW